MGDSHRQDERMHEAEPLRIVLMVFAAAAGIGGLVLGNLWLALAMVLVITSQLLIIHHLRRHAARRRDQPDG
jgi:membrane protein implicated in regulation of membrane protease activity